MLDAQAPPPMGSHDPWSRMEVGLTRARATQDSRPGRREALRALVSVGEAQHVPEEIRDRLLVLLRTMSTGADHKVLQLEAARTLRQLTP